MKKTFLFLLLIALTVNSHAFGKSLQETAFNEVVAIAIQTLKEVFPDLTNIKERHYADAIGEIKGVLTTLKDAAEYQDNTLKETVFRESLTELNKSLERSFSLALRMAIEAKDAQSKEERNINIHHARSLGKLYKQLAHLKKELHLAFNEKERAIRFEVESAHSLEKINQEIMAATQAPLPFLSDDTKKSILELVGAVVVGVVMFIVGSFSASE